MNRTRARSWLAAALGVVFIFMGIAEMLTGMLSANRGGGLFWFLSLYLGGTLILLGTFAAPHRRRLSATVVIIGCIMAAAATLWTVALPILTVALFVLTLLRLGEPPDPEEDEDADPANEPPYQYVDRFDPEPDRGPTRPDPRPDPS